MTHPLSNQGNSSPSTSEAALSSSPADEGEYLGAFERVEAAIRAVPEDDLAPVNIDVPTAVSTVLGSLPEIYELREGMIKLDGFDMTALDSLKDYAQALGHAHSLYRATVGPKDPVGKLGAEVTAVRDQLFADAQTLARRELLDEKRVEHLRSPSGYRNIAFDTLGLVALFREHAPALAGKTPVTNDEVERAARLAEQLIAAIGEREQAPTGNPATVLLRQQVFTLFTRAYNEVRRAVSYLRWRTNDGDTIAPSLWAGRGKRSSSEVETSEPPPAQPPATPPVVATPAAPSSPTPAAGSGSGPFMN